MVQFEIPDKWISNTLKVGGLMIVLFMAVTLIRPSLTGNVVNRVNTMSTELSECRSELNSTEVRLESTDLLVGNLSDDVSNLTHQYYDCAEQLNHTRTVYEEADSEIDLLESNYSELVERYENVTEEHSQTLEDYSELVDSSAHATCCINIGDDDTIIGSYDVVDNNITCRTGSRGEYNLSCD